MATASTQRFKPPQSSTITSSSDNRPTVVLCSSKDDHLLSQDICILCGSLGKDDEGNLISCSQCGQCYHPYCVNIKGLKVVVSKGWRCLDCTVCETCGQPGDEGKLLLCDECELSYHTYCLNPPLEDVPPGAWKCHWCVICQKCKSHSAGLNSDWQKNYTECGPCASQSTCPKCHINYNNGDLIIQCTKCSRWLHAECDSINDENDCAIAREMGYSCLLCRPKDEIPPHLARKRVSHENSNENVPANHDTTLNNSNNESKFKSTISSYSSLVNQLSDTGRPQSAPSVISTDINNQLVKRPASSLYFTQNGTKCDLNDDVITNDINFDDGAIKKPSDPMLDLVQGSRIVDGVYLSEIGLSYIKSQKIEPARRQRAKRGTKMQKLDDSSNIDELNKDDDEENKLVSDKNDDDGKKKRVRKLSKAGIGGFTVRQRGVRVNKDDDFNFSLTSEPNDTSMPTPPQQLHQSGAKDLSNNLSVSFNGKPKRVRKKPKKKTHLSDQYPSYLQEAFFGKKLLTSDSNDTENRANELNDCSNLDLDSRDAHKLTINANQVNGINKFNDFKNGITTSEGPNNTGADGDGDIMDVFLGDSRATDDSSENKRDFDQDLLNINLDLVKPLDSSVVEDVLNGLGNTQQSNPTYTSNDSNCASNQPQMISPSIRSIPDSSLHYDHSPHMMPPQTPSPRMQFNRPQMQPHTMIQATKARPTTIDPNRAQSADPFSIPPNTPRPMPLPQRSPFSPQSPYPAHPMNSNASTPPITPRTPSEQSAIYLQTNDHLTQGQRVQLSPQFESHQSHMPAPPVQYQQQMRPSQQPQQSFANQQQPRMDPIKQNPTQDWETEEILGHRATKSAVLYTNIEHPNLKLEFRSSEERFKQIQKLWRQLPAEKRKPYVEKARENRSASKVTPKPVNEVSLGPKKSDSPLMQQPRSQTDGMHIPSQQIHMPPQAVVNSSQDTRWRQPMPIENTANRYSQSPHQTSHHMMHESSPSQPMSPSIRPMMESHFEPGQHQMLPHQTTSPQVQYSRPPQQQPMMSVPRVRPPMIDPNRGQPVDPYSIPPSTPRPHPVQQRSPYSPHSPFPTIPNVASSTPPMTPITPRTPNEHAPIYQSNHPQSHQQQTFIEPHTAQIQQQTHYQQVRPPQYSNQPRMSGSMPVQQYGNQMPNGPTVINRPMSQQVRGQMNVQQPIYQQQNYRQNQPVRYVNPHQDSNQLTSSPLQQPHAAQHISPQRIQRPPMVNQAIQQQPGQRMVHPRMMQQQANQLGHTPSQHMQSQQQQNPHLQSVQHQQIPSQHMTQQQTISQQPMNVMQQTVGQPVSQQIHYQSLQMSNRIDAEDSLPLLDDEDALRELGADFNILEFADPEHDKGASMNSGGKNNIDLDPELEDIFDQDQTDEKRANEQLVANSNQSTMHHQPQIQQQPQYQNQQVMYQPIHAAPTSHQATTNQNIVENQQPLHVGSQNSMVSQAQYSPQRQSQVMNQQPRGIAPSSQYGVPNQNSIVRPQLQVNQIRMQHPQQQQATYSSSRPQPPSRYQSPINHDMHNQQHMHVQQLPQSQMSHHPQMSNQMQRNGPQVQAQYNNSNNFVDVQPQQQSLQGSQAHNPHPQHHQSSQQMHYTQQNIVYTNHQQHPQMNQPRRQFQSIPQPQQNPQQNYAYHQPQSQIPQHQQNYQMVATNQPMMRNATDMMIHDKNPIIGEPITSMEFTMYEPGTGAENQAANFLDSCDLPDPEQERSSNLVGVESEHMSQSNDVEEIAQPIGSSSAVQSREQGIQIDGPQEISQPDIGNVRNSDRHSSCSTSQEVESNSVYSSNQNINEKGCNSQGQNQLLKQLLATCPAADGPNQEISSPAPPSAETVNRAPSAGPNQSSTKLTATGIPTISFPMDSSGKITTTSTSVIQAQVTAPTQVKATTSFGPTYQARPLITSTGTAPSSNFEIKTYNVGQQMQTSTSSQSVILRASQPPTVSTSTQSMQTLPTKSIQAQTVKNSNDSEPANNVKSIEDRHSDSLILMNQNSDQNKATKDGLTSAQSRAAAKISAAKQRKSDYMAKRRADLEKEPTPPPREIKPKKRVRGPNKRSRPQLDGDEIKTNDSNSNTSESSQLIANGIVSIAPPRKRVRKSQKAKSDSESMLSSFALRLINDLPAVMVDEPQMQANMNVGAIFSCGDLNSKIPKLRGQFGRGIPITNTLLEQSHNRGRRKIIGYYHEEFPKELTDTQSNGLKDNLVTRMLDRECDSPSSIISASSFSDCENNNDTISDKLEDRDCETFAKLYTPDLNKFKPYQTPQDSTGEIIENVDKPDINNNSRPLSPSIPIDIKLPIKQLTPTELDSLNQDPSDSNKENLNNPQMAMEIDGNDQESLPSNDRTGTSLNMRLKDHGNVSVTLALTSEEADGVKRVLSKMPDLIDGSESSSVVVNDGFVGIQDKRIILDNSDRLLICDKPGTKEPNLNFNESGYMQMEVDQINVGSSTDDNLGLDSDIKPEICIRCDAVVIDRGIRKNFGDLPDHIRISLAESSNISRYQSKELVYCSIDCYTSGLMRSPTTKSDFSDVKPSFITGISDHSKKDDIKRKWYGISYARWSPAFFESSKAVAASPVYEDIKDTMIIDNSTLTPTSSSQLINHGDSSVDSNESDNSTSYSQSTSGKLGNSSGSPFSTQDVVSCYISSRDMKPRPADIIPPWPEGLNLIQVKPYKPIKSLQTNSRQCEEDAGQTIEMYEDARKCVLCHEFGDGVSDGPARLLNFFVDGWIHLNCALWSLDVYELANGALMNVELACRKAMTCSLCRKPGATLKCFKPRCPNYYHFVCALKEKCSFYEDKSVQCRQHSKSSVKEMTSFIVKRRVYINRDEQTQVAEMIQSEQQNVMRIGSLVFLNIGQLLPHQLGNFHDQNNIFPVGFKVIRYYWSYRQFNKRSKYICTIEDHDGKPRFKIVAQEFGYDDEEFLGDSPHNVWEPIINRIIKLREGVPDTITTFRAYIRGEDLFGLTEPSIVRILESLPGVETLTDYEFKFGRSPLLELPLAINPTGCARTEPKLRTHFKRPYTIHTANNVTAKSRLQSLNSGDSSSPYIKQFVHSKSSQYRKMKSEWRNNVVLARSRVQGLGLYAARDIEKHTMVIEYIGMLIRNEIAERYERIHEANNRGIYMFRLDEDRVIDATLAGGLARYINHSCNPNCVAEAVEIDRERKILIIANRKILKGEELGYDYKLAIEDDQHKISCLCGASTCKKWMN